MSKLENNNQTPTIMEALKEAAGFLQVHQREERVAELLLLYHLGIKKTELLMKLRDKVDPVLYAAFRKDLEEHVNTGIPLQHLTGEEEFLGRRYYVNRDVLIPRPETEELVLGIEKMIQERLPGKQLTIADIGTGSGIIATSLKLAFPAANVIATDISERALLVAKSNSKTLGASITVKQGSYLEPVHQLNQKVNVLVSNPPYIDEADKAQMADTVKYFDPTIALFADDKGLAAYKAIVQGLPDVLAFPAVVGFEIGWQQGEAVQTLLQDRFPAAEVEVRKDINGKDRMVFAWIEQ
ncbi:peptide chain release factor N(5)-glutamine methyltransferase [Terribacillus sp. DMT04]|uniref:peptide chain release factor N(5)-glutamine methyltransferase n=1 Tax=Terribacillus sp. DMT04 TaxID=2850441 RepID=UPI0020B8A077|nr:peptide chain release factor N(5)-glutamine methyltransferase [Terribacillus sp. DMT04]